MNYLFESLPDEISNRIDSVFLATFLEKARTNRDGCDDAELIDWLGDFGASWWSKCLMETCQETGREDVFGTYSDMEWDVADLFGVELADACEEFLVHNSA